MRSWLTTFMLAIVVGALLTFAYTHAALRLVFGDRDEHKENNNE